MDYEKRYKEALKRAKELLLGNEHSNTIRSYFEHIFPELRESEDERIRKEIISLVLKIMGQEKDNLSDDKYNAMLAWLEKQKEPHYTKRNELFDKCVEKCDPAIMKEVSDKVDEMLGKEQKPSCWNSPVMTHEMIMEKQKEPKPAEWSEEDERNWNNVWDVLDGQFNISEEARKKACVWFKSLRHQPKQEWSKEDEKMLQGIIERGQSQIQWCDTGLRPEQVTWLKSLRPSWKPSEEHLSALLAVFNDPNNIGSQTCQLALTDLYEQLKKL